MRIRQIRPEFWTDETIAALPDAVRLFYIGLWGVADDAGWIEWQPHRIGALLYPYRTIHRRETEIKKWAEMLVDCGRLRLLDCGCGHIATLPRHQRIGGNKTMLNADRHFSKHQSIAVRTSPDKSGSNVTLGNVTVGTRASLDDIGFDAKLRAAGGKKP